MAGEPTTAFVLSGGASLGAVQAGMLRALYERDVAPDLIVGSSVGALNGGFIATRPATPETARQLADVWRGISRGNVFPLDPLTGFLGFSAGAITWSQTAGCASSSASTSSSGRSSNRRCPSTWSSPSSSAGASCASRAAMRPRR